MRMFAVVARRGGVGGVSGGGGGSLEDAPGPSGSASFTVNFGAVSGVDGVVLYYDTATNASVDPADWPYRKVRTGDGLTSVTVTGVAVDNYFCKPAGYYGSVVGDLGQEIEVTAA